VFTCHSVDSGIWHAVYKIIYLLFYFRWRCSCKSNSKK